MSDEPQKKPGMKDDPDPQKTQKDFMDAFQKMMEQGQVYTMPFVQPEKTHAAEEEKKAEKPRDPIRFELKPKDVKKHLDRFVIKQEEAKRVLATAVCDHYRHIAACREPEHCRHYMKQNVLMLGPTGVGKTYLVKSLSELIGVPFTKADATKYSETGYVGGDVEDLVRDLVHKAGGDIALAESGIIYLDEIDKISSPAGLQGRDVSGSGVQRGLLKIMEETQVPLRNPQDLQSQLQAVMEFQQKGKIAKPLINTRHILLIASGAFGRLEDIIERRLKKATVGFLASGEASSRAERQDLLRRARTEDFVEYGFEPEFVGRLPVRVVCDPLSAEDLHNILTTSEGSILRQYEAAFAAYGIKVRFEDAALQEIAQRAAGEGTGARGLATVLEKALRDFKYELPSSSLRELTVDKPMVRDPAAALQSLLREDRTEKEGMAEAGIREFEKNFFEKCGIPIEFDGEAVGFLKAEIAVSEQSPGAFLEKLFSNYAYGLGLIQKRRPREKYRIPREGAAHPGAVLEQWIKDAYEAGSGGL